MFLSLDETLENQISQSIRLCPELNDFQVESSVCELDIGFNEIIEILDANKMLTT